MSFLTFLKKKRAGSNVIDIAVELIIFAAIGITALVLLATSATTGLSSTVAFLAITFVSLMAIIGIAIGFIRKGGFASGI